MRNRFDQQLHHLDEQLTHMGELCEIAISKVTQALKEGSAGQARIVVAEDEEIDQMEKEIERLCLKLLLQQQPVAKDLRRISAALKMITDMERIGDQTSDIAEIKTVDTYDQQLKQNDLQEITGDYELTLLQRQFVKSVGYEILQALAKYSDEYKDTISWLMNDKETLRLYLAGGKPEGSYLNSVKVLSRLYTTYKTDLANDNITSHGTKYSDLYRKMILSLSLTASGKNYFFFDGTQVSDPVTRYQIYKDLHLHKGQDQELIENEIFESLTVEEMRFVMNTIIDDEEIVWLNHYVRNDKNGATSPYSYIKYTSGYEYTKDQYYSEENYDKWDEKYHLSKYNIPYKYRYKHKIRPFISVKIRSYNSAVAYF